MLGLVEILVPIFVLGVLCAYASVQEWIVSIGPGNLCLIVVFLTILMVGQGVNESRKLFPFVRWSMYTEVYEKSPISNGKFQAVHSDGTTSWINPAASYVSLSRNNHERVLLIMNKISQQNLSRNVTRVFEEYMRALGNRYQSSVTNKDLVEVRAILEHIQIINGKRSIQHVVVKSLFMVAENHGPGNG